ncbi:TPA: GNAT family N-acetyltransferase [Serratia fonticola]
MDIVFKRLSDIDRSEIIALNTNPLVLRQMPLGDSSFGDAECLEWVTNKESQWDEYGYGPWAFTVSDKFVGWGGLQYENGDADLALVLHPDHWGLGKKIYDKILAYAFNEMGLKSITILLPPTRLKIKAIFRLGFQFDGDIEYDGVHFIRYRLHSPKR